MSVIGAGSGLFVETRNRLQIMVHHIRQRMGKGRQSHLQTPTKIRYEDFDLGLWRLRARRANAIHKMLSPAIPQIIPIDTRNHDILQAHGSNRFSQIRRLLRIQRLWPTMSHVTERAAPSTDIAHDHEGCRALTKTFMNIRARGFFANRM